MTMQDNSTIFTELDQLLEQLQGRAVNYAVRAEQEGEGDALLQSIFPPYVPELQPCAEDGCDTPTRSAICQVHYDAGLETLSPFGRKVLGLPPLSPFDVDTTGREPYVAGTQYAYDADGNWNPDAGPPTRTLDDITNDIAPRDTEGAVNPTLLERPDGQPLLWAQEVNWVYGKTGGRQNLDRTCSRAEHRQQGRARRPAGR